MDSAAAQFQITTQTQSDTVLPSNKSVVASGIVYAQNSFSNDEFPLVSHDMDNLPQLWTNGYLIAVDTMYLGGEWFNRMGCNRRYDYLRNNGMHR